MVSAKPRFTGLADVSNSNKPEELYAEILWFAIENKCPPTECKTSEQCDAITNNFKMYFLLDIYVKQDIYCQNNSLMHFLC